MANNRTIDIKLTQSVDSASASRSAEQVRQAAEDTAKHITAAEEAEARKRIAIAEQEAEAKKRALNAATPATPTAPAVPPPAPPTGGGGDGTRAYLRELQQMQDSMGSGVEDISRWTQQLNNLRRHMEECSLATGLLNNGTEELGGRFDAAAARWAEVTDNMRNETETASQLAGAIRKGEVSGKEAAVAMDIMRKRADALKEALRGVNEDFNRQRKQGDAVVAWQEQKAQAMGINDIEAAAAAAQVQVTNLGKAGKAATASLVKGFRSVGKAVSFVRNAVGKITFALAVINQAWEALGKLWDWMQGRSEAAKQAAQEHAEAVSQLREASDAAAAAQMEAHRKLRAADAYAAMESNIERVNKGLERSLRLKERDIAMELRRKKLALDREEWALEEQEASVKDDMEAHIIDEVAAVARLAAIEEKREKLVYEREAAELRAGHQSLAHKQERLNAGLADTEADEARLKAYRESGLKVYSPGQMKDFKARAGVQDAMSAAERKAYNANVQAVKQFLSQWGMEGLYEGWLWGDVDLPANMRELEERVKKQRETLETQLEETTSDLEGIEHDSQAAAEHHKARMQKLERSAKKRIGQALRQRTREDTEQQSEDVVSDSETAADKAKARRAALLRQNRQMIGARIAAKEKEKGVAELYSRLSESGDEAMLKRVLAELARNGSQVKKGGKGWGGEMLQLYGAENIQAMAGLRGKNREWWQERFASLQKSQKMQEKGEQLATAAEVLEKATTEYAETIGQVGAEARRAAHAFSQAIDNNRKLQGELQTLTAKVTAAQAQARYARNTGH